jgi:hypothetical protein
MIALGEQKQALGVADDALESRPARPQGNRNFQPDLEERGAATAATPQMANGVNCIDSGALPHLARRQAPFPLQFLLVGFLCLCDGARLGLNGTGYAIASRVWAGFIPLSAERFLRDNDPDDADLSRATPNQAKYNRR